jgi:ssDNA-binding Zn-finger/Zn-ribbon topoisomerase 1
MDLPETNIKVITADLYANFICPECDRVMLNYKEDEGRYTQCENYRCKNFKIKFRIPYVTMMEY